MKDYIIVQIDKTSRGKYLIRSKELSFEISLDLIIKHKLKSDEKYSRSILEKIYLEQQYYWANEIAINFINYKPRTIQQIKRKLEENEFENEVIQKSIDHLLELNMLNDHKYAEMFYSEKNELKNWSYNKIKNELFVRGVDINILDLSESEILDNEKFNCKKNLDKRLKYSKDKKKLKQHLISKGFRFDVINELIDALSLD